MRRLLCLDGAARSRPTGRHSPGRTRATPHTHRRAPIDPARGLAIHGRRHRARSARRPNGTSPVAVRDTTLPGGTAHRRASSIRPQKDGIPRTGVEGGLCVTIENYGPRENSAPLALWMHHREPCFKLPTRDPRPPPSPPRSCAGCVARPSRPTNRRPWWGPSPCTWSAGSSGCRAC